MAVTAPLEMVGVVLVDVNVVVVLVGFWGMQKLVEEIPESNRFW